MRIMKIFITGSTGFIGSHLAIGMAADGHEVIALTRSEDKARRILGDKVKFVVGDPKRPGPWQNEIDGADTVINLVGEPVLPKRWTAERKQLLRDSRIEPTRMLVEAIERATKKPAVLLSGSAVAYYGNRGAAEVTENEASGDDFAADMCRDWEKAAEQAAEYDVRVVTLRTSFVLGEGGSLPRLVNSFKMWAGGPMGSGDQYLPWIHISDYVKLIAFILADNSVTGPVNMAAGAATNRDFSAALGRALGRPSWLPMPGAALKMMFGEGAVILLEGQRLVPRKALDAGYVFQFSDLDGALTDIVG
jgi:hypothetical protein